MKHEKIRYRTFEKAILESSNEYHVINAITLDLLYSDIENTKFCHYITMILGEEYRLGEDKLNAIIDSLLEYQILYPLSDKLVTKVLDLIYKKMDGFKNFQWIHNAFIIIQRAFSIKRFDHLLNMATSVKPIPDIYISSYLETINKYVNIASNTYSSFPEYSMEKRNALKQIQLNFKFEESYLHSCLKKIESYLESIEPQKQNNIQLRDELLS